MGNTASEHQGSGDEVAMMKCVVNGDVGLLESLLRKNPTLIYAHSKAGENIWHFAAQGGHLEVCDVVMWYLRSSWGGSACIHAVHITGSSITVSCPVVDQGHSGALLSLVGTYATASAGLSVAVNT